MSTEWIGIVGTVLILIGFTSDREKVIRAFDMIGSLFFIVYGAAIGSISTIVLNSVLAFVHVFKFAGTRKSMDGR